MSSPLWRRKASPFRVTKATSLALAPQTKLVAHLQRLLATASSKRSSTINHSPFQPQGTLSTYSSRFNWKTIPTSDETLEANTHKYGRATMHKPHPCINDPHWSTTFRQSFRKPLERSKPNTRHVASCKDLLFDPKVREAVRPSTVASGFGTNAQLFDGGGWVPHKSLHSDMLRTEYRNRFNQAKPFHKTNLTASTGRLLRKSLVYDKE